MSKPFPSDVELRKSLIEMNKWNKFKNGLTKSVRSEKHNRIYSIEQQYRQPLNAPVKKADGKIQNPFDKDYMITRYVDVYKNEKKEVKKAEDTAKN